MESKKRHLSTLQKDNSLNNSIPHLGILTVAVPASALVSEYKINDLEQHDCLHLLKIHTSSPEQLSFAPIYTVQYKHIIKCAISRQHRITDARISHFSYFHF